ncbi:MAG: hypothetical protein JKY34_15525 [Kordiimonadaceae bacterium]|nr:hypothetical protein [Kordiimonadaceae bacterium]
MHPFKSRITNLTKTFGAAAFLAATVISAPIAADHTDTYDQPFDAVQIDPTNPAFREANPIRVYIAIQTEAELRRNHTHRGTRHTHNNGYDHNDARAHQGDRSRQQAQHQHADDNGFEQRALRSITRTLPHNIILVGSPRHSDMTVRVRQKQYDINFRIVDVDEKDKKYKKKYRNAGGSCGLHHRAFYTRVKEKGEANAYYDLKFTLKGLQTYRNSIHVRSSEKFSYAKNLRARTNCGVGPTKQLPSKGVTKLFYQASPHYRQQVVNEIRREAADDLGRTIARKIKRRSNQHYVALAERLNHGAYYENQYNDAVQGLAALFTLIAKN